MAEITREGAMGLVQEHTTNENLIKHMLAVEAAMRFYARMYEEDEEIWGLTGLLHDFDWEIHPTLDQHPQDGAPILRRRGVPDDRTERGRDLRVPLPERAGPRARRCGKHRRDRGVRARARGLRGGDPRAEAAGWIRQANAAGRPILALDAPSGLDTTSGRASPPSDCMKSSFSGDRLSGISIAGSRFLASVSRKEREILEGNSRSSASPVGPSTLA